MPWSSPTGILWSIRLKFQRIYKERKKKERPCSVITFFFYKSTLPIIITFRIKNVPIPVAARSKVNVHGRSILGLRVRTPLESWTFLLLWVFCVVRERFLRWTDHLSRGVLPSLRVRYVCVCVIRCNNNPPHQQWIGTRVWYKKQQI
jgi:hypothetical protein